MPSNQLNHKYPSFRKRAGLRDVAAVANTSIATVSRVLNKTGYYSEEIRNRVLEAAKQLNYQPNLRAKALRQRYSHTIGLLIPNLLNAYYTALADDISWLLSKEGFQLLLSSTRDNVDMERSALRKLIGHDVDGLIWVPTAPDEALLNTIYTQQIPTVSVVRSIKNSQLDTIVFEDLKGAYAATQQFIQLGHTRIGYIGGDVIYSSNYDRWQGYLKAMAEANLTTDERLIKLGKLSSDWGSVATNELLCLQFPPTALFIASNAIMPGVIKTLRNHHISIPNEISLICFDDLDWFSFSQPPICAISTSHTSLAEACVDQLLQRITNPMEAHTPRVYKQISFKLVMRESIAAPPGM